METTTTLSVSRYLKERLEQQQEINKSYSLRAFALKLGLSPGGLAHILSGKKKLSLERAHEIVKALKLSKAEKTIFLLAVEFEQAKKPERKAEVFEKIKNLNGNDSAQFFDLSVDQFKLISHWSSLAILECISSYGNQFDARKIASHFSLTVNEAALTLERLERLELITKNSNNEWQRVQGRVFISSGVPNEAIRNYYKGVAQKSFESYDTQSPDVKVSGAEVFAFDPTQLEEVRRLTNDYLDKLQTLALEGKNKTTIYQAITNVFKISK